MLCVLHSQHHACWCSGDLGASASVGMVLTTKPEYSISSIRRVKMSAKCQVCCSSHNVLNISVLLLHCFFNTSPFLCTKHALLFFSVKKSLMNNRNRKRLMPCKHNCRPCEICRQERGWVSAVWKSYRHREMSGQHCQRTMILMLESYQPWPSLPEASFGLWVLSLPASVCLSVRPCVYACVSITSLSTW